MKKRLTSFLLIVAMLVTMIPGNALTALASEQAVAFESGLVASEENDSEVDNAMMGTVDGPVIETPVETLLANSDTDATPVTRIEWLAALVETFEMVVEEDNYPDNYYSDLSSDSEDYVTAMVATEFGLVDVEAGDALRGSDAATREFVAHSLNLCLGYNNTSESYTFSESDSVTYPDDIQVAVDKGWFTLTDGAFLPENALTVTEKDVLIATAKAIYESTALDPDHVNTWEFAEGVIDLTSGVQAQMTDENEYTLTDCTYELKADDIYAVLIDGMPLVKKVVSVTTDGTACVVVTADVELEEAFASLDIQGSAKSDLTQTIACSEDVQIEYVVGGTLEEKWQDGEVYNSAEALGGATADAIIITKSMEIPAEVKKAYNIADGITADITCTATTPDVEYDAKVITRDPYAYAFASTYLTFDCNVSIDVLEAMGVAPSLELFYTPLPFGIGYFKVNLEMALKGSVTLSLVEYVSVGVQVNEEDGFRFVKDFHKESFTISAHAEASVGVKAELAFNIFYLLKADLYAGIGAKAVLDAQTYDDGNLPLACTHINAWMYVYVGGSASFLWMKDSFYEDVYTQRNSPLKISFHYEDGACVDRCTRDDVGTNNATNSNTTTSRWKYYTPANSRYGYNGASKGTGSNGQPYTIFEYELESGNATITKYNGNVSALTIPSTLDGYSVAGIDSGVFKGNTLLRVVTIPDSVTYIGSSAFSGCSNLISVKLSKNLQSAGKNVFYNCDKIASIEIPKSLEEVTGGYDGGLFNNCDGLKSVTFETGTTWIATWLFVDCTGLEQIEIPNTVTEIKMGAFEGCTNLVNVGIPESVTQISSRAFYKCGAMKQITIPDSVTLIEGSAFASCSGLESVEIPDSVTSIGSSVFSKCSNIVSVKLSKNLQTAGTNAFYDCDKITSIEIPKSLEEAKNGYDGGLFNNCDGLKSVTFETGTTWIATWLFVDCTGLEQIEIPNTVTEIRKGAFEGCTNLVNVGIPESVTQISSRAFNKCGAMKQITIPDSVTSIESSAFASCSGLERVEIPDSVTSIGSSAFSKCSNLASVKLSKNLQTAGTNAFYDCDKITSIEIPKSLEEAKNGYDGGLFNNCDGLKSVTFETGTTWIATWLFVDCTGLEQIEIPNTVTEIRMGAFEGCTNLVNVGIPESVTQISSRAFNKCGAMKQITIPDSVTSIESSAFASCSGLESIEIPESITSIESSTFSGCSKLATAILPECLLSIGTNAFANSGLTTITIPASVKLIESNAFQNCASLQTVIFEEDSVLNKIESKAFQSCDVLSSIIIPDSVTSIGTYIFDDCALLADVTLGTGITTIPSYAFNLCPSLVSIVIPYRVTTINSNAFTNCTKLAEVTIPRATTTIADGVFSYPSKMTIYGITGTYAETYANENSITFVNREVPATALTIQPAQLQLLKGKTAQLALSITPLNFTDTITWRSSDTAVATVADGKVTAVAGGTATISALAGDTGAVKATCVVTVVQPVTRVNIDKSSITMEGGDTYTLVATVTPDTAHDKTLSWTSSDETVATVSQEGVVTALKKGTAKITATAQDGSEKSDYCNVTVNSTAHIVTSVEELQSIHPYANNTNEAWIYTLENADGLAVTFSSETALDDGYDFVYIYDGEGNQVGKYTGTQLAGQTIQLPGNTVKIQLTSDDAITGWGFKVDAVTSVGEIIALESIALDKKEMVLKPGETGALTVTYNPSDTTVDKTVAWSSSDEKVATVASDGTVTAVAVGTATITAKVGEKEASCAVVVTQDAKTVITLSVETLKLHHKENAKLTYTMEPSDANIQTLQAVCSAEDVVSVTVAEDLSYVEVTGLKAGTAVITVTADEKISATCTVTVEDTIALDYQDGTGKTETIKAAYGEALTALASIEPVREGYLFVGWYTEVNGKGSRVTKDTILSNQWVLYAYWRIVDVEFWIEPIEEQMYTGKAIKPAIVVYDGLTLLEEKKDYTISYKNNVNANDASDIYKAPMAIVKGKGNYTGTVNVTFKILPQNIEDSAFAADDMAVKYNAKKVQKMVPSILWKGKKLKVNKDFTVSYPDTATDAYKALGTYTVKVAGTGNFTGERDLTLTITEGNLMSKAKVAKIAAQAYQNGKPITPAVSVKMGKETLTEGVHYEVRYENNCEVGTASAVIIGKAGYSGVKRVTFKITGTALNKANISGLQDKVYNGRAQTQALKLNLNGAELQEGKDYVLSYSKNVNVGKATVVITGIGQYSGTIKKNFKITASNLESTLSGLQFVVDGQKVSGTTLLSIKVQAAYTKGGSKPTVEIYSTTMDKWLVEGKDFVMSYAWNKVLTTSSTTKLPTMTIKGKGNFAGKLTKTFEIVPKNLSDVLVLAVDKQSSEKAGGFISKPILTDVNGKSLKEKTDYLITGYTVKYADGRTENVDATSVVSEIGAEVTVKVVGQGAYAGATNQPSEVEVTYRITAKSMKGVKVAAISKEYTGTAITLTAKDFENSAGSSKVTIKENGITKNLIYGKDFEIVEGTYTKNLKKGTATVTIKGLGEYGGTSKVKFKIIQKNISF